MTATLLEIKKQEDIRRSTDILAKLLAVENLTIIDGGCDTSYIDVANRIVHIVKFKANSPLSNKMVRITSIAHEVGHSLFTPLSLLHNSVDKKYPNLAMYINVVEDIRIERLIRNRYSGIHTTMKEGRKIMLQNGFYGKQALLDPNSLDFINKLIIYTKVGKENSKIDLNTQDECVVRYIERNAIDEQSVILVSKFLYLYCKQKQHEQEDDSSTKNDDTTKSPSNNNGDTGEGDSTQDSDDRSEDSSNKDDSDSTEDSDDSEGSPSKNEDSDDLGSSEDTEASDAEANKVANSNINELLKKLMKEADNLTDEDIDSDIKQTLESMLEETMKPHIDADSITTTCKKTTFSNGIIQVYTPTCKVRKI